MTDRLYVGNPVDCTTVRSALDYAMGLPAPGYTNGVPNVNEETRLQMVAAWWAMSTAERDALCLHPVAPWLGWTLTWTMVEAETAPGTRHACWVPGDMAAVIQQASAAGRTLTLEQVTALNAAALVSTQDYPSDWVVPSGGPPFG